MPHIPASQRGFWYLHALKKKAPPGDSFKPPGGRFYNMIGEELFLK